MVVLRTQTLIPKVFEGGPVLCNTCDGLGTGSFQGWSVVAVYNPESPDGLLVSSIVGYSFLLTSRICLLSFNTKATHGNHSFPVVLCWEFVDIGRKVYIRFRVVKLHRSRAV